MKGKVYRFAEFQLRPAENELRTGEACLRLQEKPLLLLTALLDRPQTLVTRDQLRERMWDSATFVDYEQGINVAVKKVRDALGDSAESPRIIRTVAKRGYVFLLPVEVVEPAPSAPDQARAAIAAPPAREVAVKAKIRAGFSRGWVLGAVTVVVLVALVALIRPVRNAAKITPIRAIAVLPLQNLSADPSQEYFADGMTDEVITDLAKIPDLRVISRTSTMRYKGAVKPLPDIARDLKVDAIVEGTIWQADERVRIHVQLIDARTDSHLWAESYERSRQDSLQLQDEVANAIAEQIHMKIGPATNTEAHAHKPDFEAYSAYLRGRYEWNKRTPESLKRSVEYFEDAIGRDPQYALAHEGLAEAYSVLSDYDVGRPGDSLSNARNEAMKALELDGGLGQAHATLAQVKEELDWDWLGAEAEFRQSIALSPSYATAHQWYGEYLQRVGRPDEGVAEMKQAKELDPGSPLMNAEMGGALYWARRYDDAIVQLKRAIEMEPSFAYGHSWLGFAYEQKGMRSEAIEEFQRAAALAAQSPGFVAALGHAYALAGRTPDGLRMLQKLSALSARSYVSPYDMALLYLGIGKRREALDWLEKGYAKRDPAMDMLKMEPALDALRDEPRFNDLIRRVGFPGR